MLITGGVAISAQQNREVLAAVAGTTTALAPTATITLSPTPSDTPTPTLTPTNTPTGTLPPTDTATPTFTPSPSPVPARAVTIIPEAWPTPAETPPTAIPTPVDPVPVPQGVVNIMLLGSDKREDDGSYRTDSIILVSVNKEAGTVNMLSLPRDLYVYIPGWTMNRINTADGRGASVGWPGGGPGLLKQTLLYNFGIVVHHYARVDFDNFKQIVDVLGGVDVPVDCGIQGWVLKQPRKSRADFESFAEWEAFTADTNNWEAYTLPVGVHHLDGYMALWYARVRHGVVPGQSYTDFDRARRQQQVLRAIFNQSKSLGLLPRAPELWAQYSDLIETDMGMGNMLQLLPIAADIDSSKVRSFIVTPDLTIGFQAPGADVLLPNGDAIRNLAYLAMQPPAEQYLVNNTVKVEVRNGTGIERIDEVAADRLLREGGMNIVTTGFADNPNYTQTIIYDFTGRKKGTQLVLMQRVLKVADAQVIVQPDPNRQFDYVVILGADYTSRSCTYNVAPPVELTATPPPSPTPTTAP
jgi:LCP family protein required for cell wall assembly